MKQFTQQRGGVKKIINSRNIFISGSLLVPVLLLLLVESRKKVITYNYFMEVAFGEEFNSIHDLRIKKWRSDIKIYIENGNKYDSLVNELNAVINELNSMIQNVRITIVNDIDSANFIVYFGTGEGYVREIEPQAEPYINDNWGLFFLYWDDDFKIYAGNMYVDTYRTHNYKEKIHLLREEFTQSLGLMNDSYRYKNSIFYTGRSLTDAYADIDREIIELLYSDKIKIGMTPDQVKKILN